ncbi:MAG TPA: superoxide dismutase [Paludibacteraceae bacterium]|nr:superoxide dismutase [Paludibacteraceae bacterium]HPH62549.1 superoxide dismutase [Paludibacteraceae bacterium]
MKLELKPLKYAKEALEPEISKQTLEFHHDKHLQAYVNNFNQFIEGSGLENNSLEEVIKSANGPLFNNAAQVWNHEFYFDSLTDKKGQNPLKKTEALINAKWGSVDKFKEEFEKAANSLFGSGWAWLVINSNNELEIMNESNAGNPLKNGLKPILTFDVWEHAYYLDYQNKRAEYSKKIWNIIDWEKVEERLK